MSDITLTRRGRVVVGVCVLALGMALAAGGRSLNAVVLSGVVALVAGYVQVARLDPPRARRSRPGDGYVGESREVSIDFHGRGTGAAVPSPFVASVTDRLDDGLVGPTEPIRTTVGTEPATYRLRYAERGERRIGPTVVEPTDVFGLFTRRMVVGGTDSVLAYPKRRRVPAWFRRGLYAEEAVGASRQREEFDRLREYARGDALRDVHWPTTAKHDELVVKEFAAETERRRVSITGETPDGEGAVAADALASAAASLGLSLLADGVPLDVTLPGGTVSVEPGPDGQRRLLELTARTGPGPAPEAGDPDVRIVATGTGAVFHADGQRVPFDQLHEEGSDVGSRGPQPDEPSSDGDPADGALADGGEPQ